MSAQKEQSYKNHAHTPKELFIECALLLPALLAAGYVAYSALANGGEASQIALALAFLLHVAASIYIVLHLRFACLKLQDRIIRQEVRFRLSQVLPEDLRGRVGELDLGQLVSLRFAADNELAEITRKVLDGNITNRAEIKKMIKNWQADWMRI